MQHCVTSLIACLLAALLLSTGAQAQDKPGNTFGGDSKGRLLVVISDLHMGLGKFGGKGWHPTEDFRWPRALQGFLDHISKTGEHAVDLVIAGDFVELWQPPAHIKCAGASAELGCTVEEMTQIATIVAREHTTELAALATFAERGDNRLYLIPGNHDSALLLDSVWKEFSKPLRADRGRVQLVHSGVWSSADGRIVVEHGHQIGADVNRYEAWPDIVRAGTGASYVVRPWGERFVQRIFNEQEEAYPIIDNLSPEAAGVRYRMTDRGAWGTAADMARFLAFNIFETSARQKLALLGPPKGEDEATKWNRGMARSQGHKLYAAALPADDAFRAQLLAQDAQAKALRDELDRLVADPVRLSDEDLFGLCDLAAASTPEAWKLCRPAELGSLIQAKLVPLSFVLRRHMRERRQQYPRMTVFIYGHTHEMQPRWELPISSLFRVSVLNSGAFQRLIDEEGFVARVRAKNWTEAEGLRRMQPEDLAPCFGVVIVPYRDQRPEPEATLWWMPETENTGKFLAPGDPACK